MYNPVIAVVIGASVSTAVPSVVGVAPATGHPEVDELGPSYTCRLLFGWPN